MAELDDCKAALSAQLSRARSRVAAHSYELADDLNVPAKIKRSVSQHRGIWLGAAALFGLIITQLPRRTKKVTVERKGKRKEEFERAGLAAVLFGVLKLALNVFKPLVVAWVSKRVEEAVAVRESRR